MANINTLVVYQEARELVRIVQPLTENVRFGDLGNQLRRAVISVVSNICEGGGSGSDRQFIKYCKVARGSVNEAQGQLHLLADLGYISAEHTVIELSGRVGKRLTCLIRALEAG